MAYTNFQNCTRQEYQNIIYSGDAVNKLKLWVDDTEIEDIDEYCEQLTINSRVFPNGSTTFNINELISKEVEIIVHDLDPSIFDGVITFSIGTLVDEENNTYEYVPMGVFNLQETPTTDNGVTTIKLRDNSVKFDVPYNAKPVIDENGGTATLWQILEDICETCGVTNNITHSTFLNKQISIYDSTITARTYIGYIAAFIGKMPIINRSGQLGTMSMYSWIQKIPLNVVESYELGDPYTISKVVYESGIIKYESGTDTNDTMYLDSANVYIDGTTTVGRSLTYNGNKKVDSVTTGNILGDPSIDSWDGIQVYGYYDENGDFVADENTIVFETMANNTLTYSGVCTTQFETTISKEERTTNVSIFSEATYKRNVKTEIDTLNGAINLINEEYLDFTKMASGSGYVEITNVAANGIMAMEITGDFSILFPSNTLYPSDNLYPLDTKLVVEDSQGNKQYYHAYISGLSTGDKYIYKYEYDDEQNCYTPKSTVVLGGITYPYRKTFAFDFTAGNYKIYLENFDNAQYQIQYIVQNELTTAFAPNTQLSTAIKTTRDEIDLQALQKVNKDDIIADLNVAIRDGKGTISLTGDKVVIDSENFKVTGDGTLTTKNASITGGLINLTGDTSNPKFVIKNIEDDSKYIELLPSIIRCYNSDTMSIQMGAILTTPLIQLTNASNNSNVAQLTSDYITLTNGSATTRINATTVTPGSLAESKQNFELFKNGLNTIKDIDIYSYNYKNENNAKKHIGFVIGNKFKYSKKVTSDDNTGVDLYSFVSVCCQAIKEQQEMIENLQKEVEKLKEEG